MIVYVTLFWIWKLIGLKNPNQLFIHLPKLIFMSVLEESFTDE